MAYRLDQTKEDAIYDFVVASLGIDVAVIWDKPNAKRPDLPYVTLNISGGPIAIDDRPSMQYKTLDTWTYGFKKRITLSINFFGYELHQYYLERISQCLYIDDKVELLNVDGLACWGFDGPRDLSSIVDTEFEFRGQLDVFLSYGDTIDSSPGEIKKIGLNGEVIEVT